MSLDITREREDDGRIKITATEQADEWGTQVAHTVWTQADADLPAYANAVGRAVIALGYSMPEQKAAKDPGFRLQLGEPEPAFPERQERTVVVDGDSAYMRDLFNRAVFHGHNVKIDYTDKQGNTSFGREIEPKELDWGTIEGVPSRFVYAMDGGVRKQFYLSRIDRAEIMPV